VGYFGIRESKTLGSNEMAKGSKVSRKKEAGQVAVKGNGTFKDGHLKTPKKSTEQLLKEVKNPKMDKEIAKVEAKANKKKEIKNPLFLRENTEARDEWIERALKEIKGLERVDVKVNNATQPTEPTLRYKGRMVAHCAPRSGILWTNYVFYADRNKEIHKISNDGQMEDDFATIKNICEALDSMPEKTPKSKKAPKMKKELRSLDKVLEQLENLKSNKGMTIPSGYLPTNEEFVKAVEERGFKADWENRIIVRA